MGKNEDAVGWDTDKTDRHLRLGAACDAVGAAGGEGCANADQIVGRLRFHDQILHYTSGEKLHRNVSDYFDWLRWSVRQLIHSRVDIVLYQAGADAHVNDPLGGLLSNAELARRDRAVFRRLMKNQIPIAWNLAGGYQRSKNGSISKVITIHRNTTIRAVRTLTNWNE